MNEESHTRSPAGRRIFTIGLRYHYMGVRNIQI